MVRNMRGSARALKDSRRKSAGESSGLAGSFIFYLLSFIFGVRAGIGTGTRFGIRTRISGGAERHADHLREAHDRSKKQPDEIKPFGVQPMVEQFAEKDRKSSLNSSH